MFHIFESEQKMIDPTKKQADAVAEALDVYARLCLG
jgi:hypothetical protein